jgi:adenylate cyclase
VLVVQGLENCSTRNGLEQALCTRRPVGSDVRLACQTTVHGDVTLRRLVLDDEDLEVIYHEEVTPERLRAAGEEQAVAILFADIRNFTPLSESQLPYDVIHLLNRYYHRAAEVIGRHHGRVSNYMGDGIMALFGLEDHPDAEPALDAVCAGLELIESIGAMRPYLDPPLPGGLRVGVGIHHGLAVVGTVGTSGFRQLTAIGDAVNFAARIESANKELGTQLLVSEAVYRRVSSRVTAAHEHPCDLKGKSGTHRLWEITGITQEPGA